MVTGQTGITPDEGFSAGSMTVAVGGTAIRWATSAFRVLVLNAAAKKLGCSAEELVLEDGAVLRAGKATGLDLAALAGDLDLDQKIADFARPRSPEQRKQHGDVPRLDLKEKLVGTPFVHDIERQGMLYGKPLHPPTITSKLKGLDLEALKARPGVVAVVRNGSFIGIVAETEMEALSAARWAKRRAKWVETVQAPNDAVQAIAASSEPAETVQETGQPEEVDGRHFETTISRPYLYHGSIGPSAAIAEWDENGVTIWSHSQGVYQLRKALSMALALPEEQIAVKHHLGCGCYGHNSADDVALDAALMARVVPGRPVRVVWTRADEFQAAPLGPAMVTRCEATVDAGGRLAAMLISVNSAPHGNRPSVNGNVNLRAAAYLEKPLPYVPSNGLPLARGGDADRNAVPLYAIPNVKVEKRIVHSLPYRSSSLRALGAYANIYAIETLMDEIADGLGEDSIVFRLRHLDDPRAKAVIETVADRVRALNGFKAGEDTGWGLGFARYKNTSGYCAVMVRVEVGKEVRVTHVQAVADIGEVISHDGALNQIEGGIIQSLSWTLKEAARLEGTRAAAENWLDYPILRFSEVPELEVHLIDRPDEAPLGAGEVAQGPAAAAVGNAVRAVLGVTIRDLPLTREAVMRALL